MTQLPNKTRKSEQQGELELKLLKREAIISPEIRVDRSPKTENLNEIAELEISSAAAGNREWGSG